MKPEIKQPKIHAGHMECAVAALLNYRVYTIVPNVSWGAGFRHECDMLAIDSERRFTEVEIKISLSDLKADFKKSHGHKSNKISRLVYAIPDFLLEKGLPLIPQTCGVIAVRWSGSRYVAYWVRQARHKVIQKPTEQDITNVMRLGCMRIWSLKSHNNKAQSKSK